MKNYVRLQGHQGPKGNQFSDKVTPNIEVVFSDEPVIQCYV